MNSSPTCLGQPRPARLSAQWALGAIFPVVTPAATTGAHSGGGGGHLNLGGGHGLGDGQAGAAVAKAEGSNSPFFFPSSVLGSDTFACSVTKRAFSQRLSQTLAGIDLSDDSLDGQAHKRERLSFTLAQCFAPALDTREARQSLSHILPGHLGQSPLGSVAAVPASVAVCSPSSSSASSSGAVGAAAASMQLDQVLGPASSMSLAQAGVVVVPPQGPPAVARGGRLLAGEVAVKPAQVAVGRNAEFSFTLGWLDGADPVASAMLRPVLRSIHRAFEVVPGEFPGCSSGRGSSRRVGIPVFDNPHAPSMWVCEFDLAWNKSKCLHCISLPRCDCSKPILISHRPDMKVGCQSGMLWDAQAERFTCRMHIDERFHTSSLLSPEVTLTITFYDATTGARPVFWEQTFPVVSRNKHYRRHEAMST